MSDYYNILASTSAVLGGFSLAFLGVILSGAQQSRAADWTVRLATLTATLFTVTGLGWSLAASAVSRIGSAESFLTSFGQSHRLLSLLFLAGIGLFVATIGISGWLRSRSLGWFSTLVAGAGLVLIVRVLSPFID